MFEGKHISLKTNLSRPVEGFFRCAYRLPSEDFQASLGEINNYAGEKLQSAHRDFLIIFEAFEYETILFVDLKKSSFLKLSLLSILIDLRDGISHVLTNALTDGSESLNSAEKDSLTFMLYVIDFLFKERKSREMGKHLDLPEGVVLKLHDILNHAFQNHLGVKLPKREDIDTLTDFPLYIHQLMRCWKDQNSEDLNDP